jgi:hypothetical protein
LIHLEFELSLVELLDSFCINISVEIRGTASRLLARHSTRARACSRVTLNKSSIRLLFNPEVFRGLEIIPENTNNFLDLIVTVSIHEEVHR